ncbi:MAG: tRNA (N6-threonylcarbamoyladenosine(37)-N6)-methyltransferase TrmO [Bacteroidetes bacterium]|nr:tRNA (N6-threonylcarbamoyladenosine(37)-N6)-methyltransferase TrmO [Bacteroidota bacterium]
MDSWTFNPIATVASERRNRYDVPRQGTLDASHTARVLLLPGRNFEQALDDLEGFERIWLIYVFHLNTGWKPRVHVPRHRADKVGVFATRAPYRPNPVGLSCVRLLGIDGLTLHIAECDLLDGTPVLDIKPYLPYADSFTDAATGWVPRNEELYTVQCQQRAEAQLAWLREHGVDIFPFARTQLEAAPRDGARKRVYPSGHVSEEYMLAYRTWRLRFRVDDDRRVVDIQEVFSGYSEEDLASPGDRYEDKDIHHQFNNHASFPWPDR